MEKETELLLQWYDEHGRSLPWRGLRDPYATWVSEVMLQQTRVETVLRYFPRFMERFPTVEALAEAPEEDVLKLWEGLGYYRRARNLQAGSQQVMREMNGILPKDPALLGRIRGIGDYTAGAIASIAFGRCVPAVDGNVVRVISRFFGIRENTGLPSVRRRITEAVRMLLPEARPGDFNQALMDLGSGICTPGTPDCDHCPWAKLCDAYAAGDAEELPVLPDRTPPKELAWDVCLIRSGSRLLMRCRTEAMLQGLWVFPMLEGHFEIDEIPAAVKRLCGLRVNGVHPAGEGKHVFTHQVWLMKLYIMETDTAEAPAGWRFVTLEELRALAVPTAMKAAVKAAEELQT